MVANTYLEGTYSEYCPNVTAIDPVPAARLVYLTVK
jgi:hypothetical protein